VFIAIYMKKNKRQNRYFNKRFEGFRITEIGVIALGLVLSAIVIFTLKSISSVNHKKGT